MSYNNQLSPVEDFKTDNIVFSKPEVGNIPGQKISFKRVRIAVRNADQTVGDLIFSTPEHLHSFGLQESKNMDSGKLNGYVLPICLWSRNGPLEKEQRFTDVFTEVSEYCKQYLVQHREEIEKYDLDLSDLKKFNPLFWKTEKGKIVEGRGPMLYCKVLMSKKANKINTIFVDEESNREIDPFTIMNKPCQVTAAIKIESIFVGNKISLQVKLYEVVVKQIDTTMRGLLRPTAFRREEENATVPKTNPYGCLQYSSDMEDEDMEEEERGMVEDRMQGRDGSDTGSIVFEEEEREFGSPVPCPSPPSMSVVESSVVSEKKKAAPKGKRGGK